MNQDLGVRKHESLSVHMALGLHQALRNRLAAEKRRLRQIKRTATPLQRYEFSL